MQQQNTSTTLKRGSEQRRGNVWLLQCPGNQNILPKRYLYQLFLKGPIASLCMWWGASTNEHVCVSYHGLVLLYITDFLFYFLFLFLIFSRVWLLEKSSGLFHACFIDSFTFLQSFKLDLIQQGILETQCQAPKAVLFTLKPTRCFANALQSRLLLILFLAYSGECDLRIIVQCKQAWTV